MKLLFNTLSIALIFGAPLSAEESEIHLTARRSALVDAQTQIDQGDSLLDSGQNRDAIEAYQKGFQSGNISDSQLLNLYMGIGEAQRKSGHTTAAIESYKKGIELQNVSDNEKAALYVNLAGLYKQERKWPRVEETAGKGLLLQGINNFYLVLLYERLAEAQAKIGRVGDAYASYENALSLNGLGSEYRAGLYMGYGKLMFEEHKYDQAFDKFNQGLNENASGDWNGRFLYMIGNTQEKLGKSKDAKASFNQGLAQANLENETHEKLQDEAHRMSGESNLLITIMTPVLVLLALVGMALASFRIISSRGDKV